LDAEHDQIEPEAAAINKKIKTMRGYYLKQKENTKKEE
jgi:hypothetical protein